MQGSLSLLGNMKTGQWLLWTIKIWPLLLVSTSRSDGGLCAQHSPETPAALRSKGKQNKLPKDHAARWATAQEKVPAVLMQMQKLNKWEGSQQACTRKLEEDNLNKFPA